MELIIGITFGMVVGQYVLVWRVLRRANKLEDQIKILRFDNRELAGRLDDIQRPVERR